jgi:hypothetical protein
MTKSIILALVLFTVTPASAQKVSRIDVVEYGIYTGETERTEQTSPVPTNVVSSIHHAVTTKTIPAHLGTKFGFRYRVVGKPEGQSIDLLRVVLFPPRGLTSPSSTKPIRKYEGTISRKIGETRFMDYTFEDSWELVPGKWTFQLWYRNRKVAEQSFTVVAR